MLKIHREPGWLWCRESAALGRGSVRRVAVVVLSMALLASVMAGTASGRGPICAPGAAAQMADAWMLDAQMADARMLDAQPSDARTLDAQPSDAWTLDAVGETSGAELRFWPQAHTAVEGGDPAMVRVVLSEPLERRVEFKIIWIVLAGVCLDEFSPNSVIVAFEAGQTVQTIPVWVFADSRVEPNDFVMFSLAGNLPADVSLGTPWSAVVYFRDADAPPDPAEVRFTAASYTAAEGGPAAEVTVEFHSTTGRRVEVPIVISHRGGADADDHSSVPVSLTFDGAPVVGPASKTFIVSAVDDDRDDDGGSLLLGFGPLPDGVTAAGPSTAEVILRDDDVPGVDVRFGSASYTAAEGGSAAEVTVVLSADPERRVEVPIAVSLRGGADADDYSGVPASLTFQRGETSKLFQVTAVDDSLNDDDEHLLLSFGPLPERMSPDGPFESTVALKDDDFPVVEARFSAASYTVVEGGSAVEVTVLLSEAPLRRVVVPLTTFYRQGATDEDLSPIPDSLVFEGPETSRSFYLSAVEDGVDYSNESVLLGFGSLSDGLVSGRPATAQVRIGW